MDHVFAAAAFAGTDLSCRRGGRLVFAGLNFGINSGEALVLRGPNGSGKTTLLRLMAGLARKSSGVLTWDGADVHDDLPLHGSRLAFAGHLDAVKPALSVRENLAFWADVRGSSLTDIDKALKAFSLSHLADLPGRVLSAGQRHRVALARVAMNGAQLWLLDEPTNTLDDAALSALQGVLQRHLQNGGMVVMASHGDTLLPQAKTLDVRAFIAKARTADLESAA
ncbi:MAG: heme ABC exporter ATP-binding protein CcmA [Rhodospirillaceae bacterium]|nr:heme ABC exporter ATP-binding protein CcmA [Rhodospirillaceae bacterium]